MSEPWKRIPQFVIAAPKSGSGKTMVACGLLQLLKNHGFSPASFKCGPDFIDPLFHTEVLGIPSGNLDTWFTDADTARMLYQKSLLESGADIAVIEGVMGYYDGAGFTTAASTYELAKALQAPAVFVVDVKGMGNSAVAFLKGYMEYRTPSRIGAVILNRLSKAMYGRYRDAIESELQVPVIGYLPQLPAIHVESRHLGLKLPQEIEDYKSRIQNLAGLLEETLDMEKLLELAGKESVSVPKSLIETGAWKHGKPVRIAYAKDEAFCFYYKENLQLLQEAGAELVEFSPLHDDRLPGQVDGLILGGGYPELYLEALRKNQSMRLDIKTQIDNGLPYLAECGGFLYLKEALDGAPMAGVLPGKAFRTEKSSRFGYITLTAQEDSVLGPKGIQVKAHEFHYYDTTENGRAFRARKPFRNQQWDCMQAGSQFAAGFPHLYYYSNPEVVRNFINKCREYGS